MTPDKIYIPAEWMNVPSNLFETGPGPDDTEYICKDTMIQVIHELQNALRLCGIEKEIKL